MVAPTTAYSNDLYVYQIGDDFTLDADQRSVDNYGWLYSNGDDNNITISQGMHEGGTIDSDETGGHDALWYILGDGNTASSYQTDTNRSGGGGDSHYLSGELKGDDNTVEITQMGKAGHDAYLAVDGKNNNIDLYQRGNGGKKWADVELSGDDHSVSVNQRGSHYASSDISLTNNGGAYDLTVTQNVTSSTHTYSITGTCATIGGCTVTVNGSN